MLVLSRRLNETIVIGNGIRVQVVEVSGQTVRLGIEAPPEVPIVRGELRQKSRPAPLPDAVEELCADCCVC